MMRGCDVEFADRIGEIIQKGEEARNINPEKFRALRKESAEEFWDEQGAWSPLPDLKEEDL